eukprot:40487_1
MDSGYRGTVGFKNYTLTHQKLNTRHHLYATMFAIRFKFNKRMKLVIRFLAQESNVHNNFSRDITQLILDYIPGKDGSLILKQNETKNLKSDVQYEFDNIIIPFASHLKVHTWEPYKNRGGRLILHCFDLVRIDNGGSIDLSKSGYCGGRHTLCCGESYDHQGPVIKSVRSNATGAGGGGMVSGGASYGSMGQDGILYKRQNWTQPVDEQMEIGYAGKMYGDARLTELYRGSGAGSSFWSGGGKGGGALLLITNNLVNKGEITCCGGSATQAGSGGASGGSLLIDVLGEKQCVLGKISAKGGMGMKLKGSVKSRGGNGGDGRICINNKLLRLSAEDHNAPSVDQVLPIPYITGEVRTDGNKYRL